MALMEWSSQLSVGVQAMDAQHQKLVGMINELHAAMKAGHGAAAAGKILKGLVDYTQTHFSAEERLMQTHGYPGLGAQKDEHAKLIQKIAALQNDLEGGRTMLTMELMNFLRDWLTNHIMGTDKKYGPYLNGKGVL